MLRSKKPLFIPFIFCLFIFFHTSCKKEEIKRIIKVTTDEVSQLNLIVTAKGTIIDISEGIGITEHGFCWSTTNNPTIELTTKTQLGSKNSKGNFSSNLTGISPGITYYVRAYATNSIGTAYGNEIEIMTIWDNSTISDFDGNVYQTITVGTQTWMAENLKTTKYNDGTAIPLVTNSTEWSNLTTPGYCWYNNDEASYKNTYGALYNWYTVNTGKLCPTGWHIPTDAEWTTLTDYLGGESVAGGKLKETGTTHWNSPNTGATNESGFTALPGGYRNYDGSFVEVGNYGYWWSSTEYLSANARARGMYYDYSDVYRSSYNKGYGFSVRCVRD